jgi:hypothetical protein
MRNERGKLVYLALALAWSAWLPARGQSSAQTQPQPAAQPYSAPSTVQHPAIKLPKGVILIKGAWSSASDSVTPLPEGGSIAGNVYSNRYFGMTWTLPTDWHQQYEGPPPSETGRYVLAQIVPAQTWKGTVPGSILITAEDLFFTPLPVSNARDLIDFEREHLQEAYKVETLPADVTIADRSFRFFSYTAPASQLHWYVLATQIRCHAVEFVFSSRDTELLETLMHDMNNMKLPAEASSTGDTGSDSVPVCVMNYARQENVIARVNPIFDVPRFNPVPVRIVVSKGGVVQHIHFLSAFPDQSRAISDALAQWRFKPYLRDGHPVEVETGIMFGHAAITTTNTSKVQGAQ